MLLKTPRSITARTAKKVFRAYEEQVFNPVQAWIRHGVISGGLDDEFFVADLKNALAELHEHLKLIVEDRERESASYGALD